MAQNVQNQTAQRTQVESVPVGRARLSQPAAVLARDRVSWGPIWAGFIVTIVSFLLMELFLFAVGWLNTSAFTSTTTTYDAWVTGVVSIVAFFLGGVTAASTSSIRGSGADIMNGFLVWALTTALIVVASVMGAGAILGAVGNVISSIIAAHPGILHIGSVTAPSLSPSQLQTYAGWGLGTLLVTAGAAALGGWVGGIGTPLGYVVAEEPAVAPNPTEPSVSR